MAYTRRFLSLVIILLIVALLIVDLSCGISKDAVTKEERAEEKTLLTTTSQLQDWEKEWQKTLEAAKKEGIVTVYSTSSAEVRTTFQEALIKKYGIRMDMVLGKGVEVGQKVSTERRNGLYLADVWMGGSSPLINTLKPINALEPIRPALILPEVTDPTVWWGNELPIFVDRGKKYIFFINGSLSSREVVILGDTIGEGELISYYDLLQPRWKGKIAIRDVTSGGGLSWFSALIATGRLDIDYMKQLAKQEPLISRNDTILIESVVRKNYLGIALGTDVTKRYKDAGVNLKEFSLKEDIAKMSAGGGGAIALMNRAPHPSAAKIFINWLLSKEGQTLWSRATSLQSTRIDIPTNHLEPYKLRIPGMEYFNNQKEEYTEKLPEQAKLSQDIFGHLLR